MHPGAFRSLLGFNELRKRIFSHSIELLRQVVYAKLTLFRGMSIVLLLLAFHFVTFNHQST